MTGIGQLYVRPFLPNAPPDAEYRAGFTAQSAAHRRQFHVVQSGQQPWEGTVDGPTALTFVARAGAPIELLTEPGLRAGPDDPRSISLIISDPWSEPVPK